jgi:hypothetical protein
MSNHPITPPPELVQEWWESTVPNLSTSVKISAQLCTKAAQWGADQELLAVEEEIIAQGWFANSVHRRAQLRAARRPKPPSLKEQALEALETLNQAWTMPKELEAVIAIRRALESLPND